MSECGPHARGQARPHIYISEERQLGGSSATPRQPCSSVGGVSCAPGAMSGQLSVCRLHRRAHRPACCAPSSQPCVAIHWLPRLSLAPALPWVSALTGCGAAGELGLLSSVTGTADSHCPLHCWCCGSGLGPCGDTRVSPVDVSGLPLGTGLGVQSSGRGYTSTFPADP